ncbi:MAG: ParB N-terminal domain-containing protein [Chloroflexi bacterium]|nr:ParB N-terminal domain-containing protein [Chloroflexota bacterium]
MTIVELPIEQIRPARWNANEQGADMRARLRRSIQRFGLVVPLVVRRLGDGYETIGGNQRLAVLQELGVATANAVVVEADDAQARLLSQSLNHIGGSDNAGLRGELLREVLASIPQQEVLALLPETTATLTALVSIGQEDIAERLRAFEQLQAARLRHFQAQLTPAQLEVVEEALAPFLAEVSDGEGGNPNRRGLALYHL